MAFFSGIGGILVVFRLKRLFGLDFIEDTLLILVQVLVGFFGLAVCG